jgi:hypothetical protein
MVKIGSKLSRQCGENQNKSRPLQERPTGQVQGWAGRAGLTKVQIEGQSQKGSSDKKAISGLGLNGQNFNFFITYEWAKKALASLSNIV